jgi:cytochrome oxidase Cu insertion factor (SCO1/SenC/PrrC family)
MRTVLKKYMLLTLAISLLITGGLLLIYPPNTLLNQFKSGLTLHGFHSDIVLSPQKMHDQYGISRTWQSYADKPLFITTGFTHCQMICPLTMQLYQALESITNDNARYALFSLEPEVDTESQLKQYLDTYSPNFIGLRVTDNKNLTHITTELHQTHFISDDETNTLEHSSYIYLIHPKLTGVLIYTQPNVDDILHDLDVIGHSHDKN